MNDRVLLIGSGGREHALARKLSQSAGVESVFVAPGNGGTSDVEKTSNISESLLFYLQLIFIFSFIPFLFCTTKQRLEVQADTDNIILTHPNVKLY